MKTKILLLIGLAVLITCTIGMTGCGVPQSELDAVTAENTRLQDELGAAIAEKNQQLNELNTVISEKAGLQDQLDDVTSEKAQVQDDLDALNEEHARLQGELEDYKAVYPLKGFETLSEFREWISAHVQPETVYISEAFSAAYKVQQEGMSDGYLFGLDTEEDGDGNVIAVFVTVFVGDELYWWYVEDPEVYASTGLTR